MIDEGGSNGAGSTTGTKVDVTSETDGGKHIRYASSFKEQFTVRGVIVGAIGCAVVTVSSMYVALKIGALPWPIIFVALLSMFVLKLLGNTNINEINVTHTIMSAGSMVAGGLAFTIPGIWMLDAGADVDTLQLVIAAAAGVILGLICIALYRKHFIEESDLPYPIGTAAAETLVTGSLGGKQAGWLFGSLGFAAIFTAVRDWFGKIPTIVGNKVNIPGVTFGIYMSPMMVAVGYIIGPLLLLVWFIGALLGDFGVVVGGSAAGLWDVTTGQGIKTSLGMGVMVGTGIGIIIKHIIPKGKQIFGSMFSREHRGDAVVNLRWAPWAIAALALVMTFVLHLGLIASIIVILGAWIATAMSAQTVGQAGINPMEVFGVIVLLLVKVLSTSVSTVGLFLVAAMVAVACGLVGDVMNDFKTGYIVHSDPKAQWIGEAIGGAVGAVVSVATFLVLLNAYGAGAFGTPDGFAAAQASVVAAMVAGIPSLPAFITGLVAGIVLFCLGLPVMTLGLGIYLPFYLSLTAFLGGAIRFIVERFFPRVEKEGTGTLIASGLLGGESIVGVIIALVMVITAT